MKLLLTSQGLYNETISKALYGLIGKEPGEIHAVFIPTAATFMDVDKSWLIDRLIAVKKQNFAYLDIVDIAALSREEWLPRLQKAELLIFGGGDPFDLMKSVRRSGLDEVLPELLKTRVFVGGSSGAMIICKKIPFKCKEFYESKTNEKSDVDGLGLVDFILLSHYNTSDFPKVNKENIEKLHNQVGGTIYALDDDSAILIDGDKLEIISEGKWEKFE